MKNVKRCTSLLLAAAMLSAAVLTGCGSGANAASGEVVIYTNADDEAMEAMKHALDANGYEGKYLMQSFGTSELGGKQSAYAHLSERSDRSGVRGADIGDGYSEFFHRMAFDAGPGQRVWRGRSRGSAGGNL